MSKLSIIIPSYNTADVLEKCLANLISINEQDEIIVVDNSSPDGSADMVQSKFPSVKLIKTENNGLAWACNKGLDASTGDILCYLGSDAFPEKGTLIGLKDFLEKDSSIGVVTPKLVLENGDLDIDAHRNIPNPWNALTRFFYLDRMFPKSKLFNQYFMGWEDMSVPHEIKLCITHFFMVKKSVFDKIGRWDEDFFLYGEDVDICFRIVKSGFKIFYVPTFKALHLKGYGVGVRATTRDQVKKPREHRLKMRRMSIAAMDTFVKKHYAEIYPSYFVKFMQLGMFLLGRLRLAIEYLH